MKPDAKHHDSVVKMSACEFRYNDKKSLKSDNMGDIQTQLNRSHELAIIERIHVTRATATGCDYERPLHQHAHGQLVLALQGGVRCTIVEQVWMVPPSGAVWIPPHHAHAQLVTHNAEVCVAFIAETEATSQVPSGTIQVSPLLRELLLCLASLQDASETQTDTDYRHGLCDMLVLELQRARAAAFAIPVLQQPRLKPLYETLLREPANRDSASTWAQHLAMSERTLLRLIQQDTGLSFARWRQQVQLLHALLQLAAGKSVQQVAMDLQYESVTAFITLFKKRLGVTPKRYVVQQQKSA